MAAVLTHSQSNIEKITFFLEECKRMGLNVKSPDVNESLINFAVNKNGDVRYGMGAVKGVGEAAVETLIEERRKKGPFRDIFDFMRRINLRTVNKRVMENLAYAGAFDSFGLVRSAFFTPAEKFDTFIENLLKYGSSHQEDKLMSVNSLFGDLSSSVSIPEPTVPKANDWGLIYKLQKEKDVIGIYLSGHPLDDFRYEWENFATPLDQVEQYKGRKVNVAGFVMKAEHRISQKGTGWGRFTIQDYTGSLEITMFSENYAKFKTFFEEGTSVYVEGEYKQRYNGDEFEFKVLNVRLLETIGEEKTTSVTLKIPVENLSIDLINSIEKICAAHKGRQTLHMELIDRQNKEKMAFTSKGKMVTVGNEFLSELEMLGVDCSVN
jgi:DNA polymerase-3 subunit alpha